MITTRAPDGANKLIYIGSFLDYLDTKMKVLNWKVLFLSLREMTSMFYFGMKSDCGQKLTEIVKYF